MILHYHPESTWSMRVWLVMQMVGLKPDMCYHPWLDDLAKQREQWHSFSPTAKIPLLENGNTRIWDSLAICLYLGEHHPRIWPSQAAARYWSYAAVAEMHSGFAALRTQCSFTLCPVTTHITPDEALTADLQRINILWHEGLQRFGASYLADERFTIADAFYAPVALRLQQYNLLSQLQPTTLPYALRILEHPWIREWLTLSHDTSLGSAHD